MPSNPAAASASATLSPPPGFSAQGGGWTYVYVAAAAALVLHLATAGRYGYFRDELYYAACGRHLDWGYVDHAPLIAGVAWFVRRVFGDSLFSLRLFPALSSAGKILLTGWMVRELGGRSFAQLCAAVVMFFCPIYLTMDSFLSMNSFEPLFWMGAAAVVMRIADGGSSKLWLLFGVVCGLGILNKHSMLFFGFALLLGLLVTSGFRYFRNPWIWLGGAIAFFFFLPNILWQIRYHYPTLEILRNAPHAKNAIVPWYLFIAQQGLLILPVAVPVVLAGLWFYLASERGRRFRFLGWTYIFLLSLMVALAARIYYLAPVYPMLFAAGAVWIEQAIEQRHWRWAKAAVIAPLAVAGLIALPLAVPLLPIGAATAYADFWYVNDVHVETFRTGRIPQIFADRFGWHEQEQVVASVYRALPEQERADCGILAGNYGEASAIDYFGAADGLPGAVSPHNAYYLWGSGPDRGEMIAVGMRLEVLQSLFSDVQQVATIENDYAMPAESDLPVYLCRRPRQPLSAAWPSLKSYL